MNKLKTMFIVVLVSLMGLAVVTEDAMARGGSRSSGSRSSYKAPTRTRTPAPAPTRQKAQPAPKKSWGSKTKDTAPKATKATAPKKSWGSKPKATTPTSRKTTKPKMSPADKKSLEIAKKNNTSFKNKDAATAAFKKNQAGKYPSKYASKPASRPEHIPATTMVGGRSVTVVYNADRGCYGYPGSTLGAFIAYDMMSDVIMRNRYMASSHYVVHNPVVYQQPVAPVVYQRPLVVRSGPSFGTILIWIILIVGIVVVVCVVGGKKKNDQSRG